MADDGKRYCNYPVPDYAADPDWERTADCPVMTNCKNEWPCKRHPPDLPVRAAYPHMDRLESS